MTYALDDLAVAVHLAQFALCFGGIATVNHQVVDDQANTRPDTEAIFRKYGRQHKKPIPINTVGALYVCLSRSASQAINPFGF
jgi:hypothetical protein